MNYDEMIEVIQAMKDGRQCQSRRRGAPVWSDCFQPSSDICCLPDFGMYEFRVKPEQEPSADGGIWNIHVKRVIS